MSTRTTHTELERLALSVADVAKLLDVSQRHIWKMLASGRFGPQPARLGRAVRFSRAELVAWIDAGCPPREQWQQTKAATK